MLWLSIINTIFALGFTSFAGASSIYRVEVDVQRSQGEITHFWKTFGLDHSGLLLETRDNWGETLKRQLAQAVTDLGLNGIRQHGILHDDVGIYREIDGTPIYDFTRADQILDYYVSLGIRPVIEFGSMPHDLAANPAATVFLWRQGVSPPKNWRQWEELIFRFVDHYSQRYGDEAVANWYFEVWNEPDLSSFWRGSQHDYFTLYDFTVAGALRANPKVRIGGPSPSGPHQLQGASRLGQNFIEHIKNNMIPELGRRLPLDFFSVHTWNFLDANINGYFETRDFLTARELNIPILVTEAGPTWQFNLNPQPHDTMQGAAFIIDTVSSLIDRATRRQTLLPEIWSWWVLSDIFEEGRYRDQDPFIGCMGLVTRQGLTKPAYNAFKLLHQMGHELVSWQVDRAGSIKGFATRDRNGSVRILMVNAKNPGRGPNDGRYYEESQEADLISLKLSGLSHDAGYTAAIVSLDRHHGDAYTAWQALGRPGIRDLRDEDWQLLHEKMLLPDPRQEVLDDMTSEIQLTMVSPSILLIEVKKDSDVSK